MGFGKCPTCCMTVVLTSLNVSLVMLDFFVLAFSLLAPSGASMTEPMSLSAECHIVPSIFYNYCSINWSLTFQLVPQPDATLWCTLCTCVYCCTLEFKSPSVRGLPILFNGMLMTGELSPWAMPCFTASRYFTWHTVLSPRSGKLVLNFFCALKLPF